MLSPRLPLQGRGAGGRHRGPSVAVAGRGAGHQSSRRWGAEDRGCQQDGETPPALVPWGSEDAGTPGRLETPRGPAVTVPALRGVLGGQQPALPRSPAWLRFVSHQRCPRCPNTPPTSQGRTTWTWCPSLGETSLEGEGRGEQEASGTARRLGTARPCGNTRLPRRPSRRQEQEPKQCLGPRPEHRMRPRLNRADEEPPLLRQPGSCLCPAGAGGSSEVGSGSTEPPLCQLPSGAGRWGCWAARAPAVPLGGLQALGGRRGAGPWL